MANRRKFLAGVGSLAAGSAAAMGTGAFNFANVERDANIAVVDDSDAFLALQSTSPYASDSGNELSITLNGNAGNEEEEEEIGSGINQNSDYSFREVFEIINQGSQSIGVWIEDDSSNDAAQWYAGNGFTDSIEESGNAYALGPGDSVTVSLVILTRDNSAGDLPETVNVMADASAGN